jgi:hypothetical protein
MVASEVLADVSVSPSRERVPLSLSPSLSLSLSLSLARSLTNSHVMYSAYSRLEVAVIFWGHTQQHKHTHTYTHTHTHTHTQTVQWFVDTQTQTGLKGKKT